MASLHKLLSEEGFQRQKLRKPPKKVKFKDVNAQEESIALPIYICHDRRSFDSSLQRAERALSHKSSSVLSSRRGGSGSERSNYTRSVSEGNVPRRDEPAIDDVAIKAMISILNGYVGQYLRDKNFRESVREKCYSCFARRKKHSDNDIFAHMELGIQSIERLVEKYDAKKGMDLDSLQKSIKLFDFVASLNPKNSRNNASTCGTPNSCLSACAQLYLSIVYKIVRNDRISARHLLQVFCDSPFLARTRLLPELWEHFFLPHLLHLKIWYTKELEFLSVSDYDQNDKKIKALNELYNDQMDTGTMKFALYYKEWLKIGAQAPSIPSIPLPSKLSNASSRRRSADSVNSHFPLSDKSLYQEVFGPIPKERSIDIDNRNGALKNDWDTEEENIISLEDDKKAMVQLKSSSPSYRMQEVELRSDRKKKDYFRFLACRTEPVVCFLKGVNLPKNYEKFKNDGTVNHIESGDMTRVIATICSSESLSDCEMAIRSISKYWLNSHGDPRIENSLSQPSVIQGIMEVLFVSDEDEILELAISILAELATKSETIRQFILNSDPQLDVSLRLLRSGSLFLKAAVLLYLVKPKAKQMISSEWIPLVLRVLEFGDHVQTLFAVKCRPHEAAYYFLDQLLTGFNEDKNLENARQLISLGGLGLLVRRMDEGKTFEKSEAASVIYYCIQANGSCRHYLAKNSRKDTILSLLVQGKHTKSQGRALELLTESLCLNRRKQRMESLSALTKGWDCLNTLHILLLCLQKARLQECAIIAVILLQLDLMGDPLECSIYREEAIDAIVKALDCRVFDERVQEKTARALLILGGHFSYTGEPEVEKWLLRTAGFDENSETSCYGMDSDIHGFLNLGEEDKTTENLQSKAAMVLLSKGNTRLISSLSNSIGSGIPCLARASLVTVCWMSCGFRLLEDKELQYAACSILVPQLIQFLNHDSALEERVLVSFSLLTLTKGTDYFATSPLDKGVLGCLGRLSDVTWTAEELISHITSTSSSMDPFS
ncbi:putative E3 ubiquitin-protein ligase LIN isoform X1 [Primulina tabacum]|uniref:putative E3 ubiquitin-protein ligase LIN isoform X1 n=1 Tax=Primulina tabacum TaxID=48773 RepID=UPI003F5A9B52